MSLQRLPRYLRVLAALRADAVGGAFGHQLPAEPELAGRYGVSRTTLRRAIAVLIDEGVLEARQGAGTFVRSAPGRTRTVGLLVSPGMLAIGDDAYFQQLLDHLLRVFARHGWTLRLAASTEDMSLRLAAGRGANVAACVAAFFGRGDQGVGLLASLPVPLVLVDSEPLADAPAILADNAEGMRQAVGRLVGLGHRRIVHLCGPDWSPSGRERETGWRAGMAAGGLVPGDGDVVPGHFDPTCAYHAMTAWWHRHEPPTAVVCANDLMALGALHWLVDHGLRPGRDVSVIGCDNLLAASLARPDLATLALDFPAHAEAVYQAVLDLDRPGIRRTPLRLIERASLGPVSTLALRA